MPGYKHVFLDKIKRKHVCLLCDLPMRDPVRITSCGHRFCDTCLQEYLSEGIFQCPEDDHPLDYAKVYPDPEVQTEIVTAMVRCVHYQNGCRWVDSLQNLQSHLEVCVYNTSPCPNQCSAMLSRMCLDDHLAYTCPRRKVKCDYCMQEFSGEAMENHQGNCPAESVWCENKCGARLQRRYLNNHMKNECHKRTLPCRYCQKQFVFETMQDHYYHCLRFPITCPNRCDPIKIAREDMEQHIKEECPSSTIMCTFAKAGCNHLCARFGLDKHLDEAARDHLNLMCQLVLTQEERIQTLTEQLQVLSVVTNGVLLWRIPNMKVMMHDSKNKIIQELKSDPFYTSQHGYKLGASVFLYGNGSGEGTHISLYIRVHKGEYDNLQEWPFRLPITFQILDQCSDPEKRQPITESFVPNPSWKHFQKPSKDVESMGFGYPKFLSHDTLKNGNYIKDDQLFIKIIVDPKKIVAV